MPRVRLQARGLLTGVNAVEAPAGALVEASDVQIVRPGIIEPRPGFQTLPFYPSGTDDEDYRCHAILPYGSSGECLLFARDFGAPTSNRWDWLVDGSEVTGLPTPRDPERAEPRLAFARGNGYISGATGTFKLAAEGDPTATQAGLWRPFAIFASSVTSGTAMPDDSSIAWCVVVRRQDPNGLITRSPPSISKTFSNGAVGAVDVRMYTELPSYAVAESATVDVLEFYRTKAISGSDPTTVGGEFYLCHTHLVTAADVVAGWVDVVSVLADADLGGPLYTNATQDGAAASNDMPPAAIDHAWWQHCMWFGNVKTQDSLAIALVDAARGDDGLQGNVAKTGCTITGASATITNLADTDEIHVGMAIGTTSDRPDDCGAYFTGHAERGLYVVSKTSTSVTMSRTAASGGAGVTVYFFDVVTVGVGSSLRYAYAAGSLGETDSRLRFTVTAANERATAASLARSLSYYTSASTDIDAIVSAFGKDAQTIRPGQLLIEEAGVGVGTPIFRSTAPLAWEPPLADWQTSASSALEERIDGLMWSKPDEPEHVPGANILYVGDAQSRILRLAPLSQALLVFTERGIFRVTGSPPNSWNLDVLDPETRLLSADAMTILGDTAYAWTNRGVVAVDAYSVRQIQEPRVGVGYELTELRRVAERFYAGNSVPGAWMASRQSANQVVLAVPAATEPDEELGIHETSERLWVYCAATEAWTTWTRTPRCGASNATGRLWLERGAGWYGVAQERGEDAADIYDTYHAAVDLHDVTGGTVVRVGKANRWVPKTGDLLYSPSAQAVHRVISYDGEDASYYTFTVDVVLTDLTDIDIYECVPAVVEWAPVKLPGSFGGLWREGLVELRELETQLTEDTSATTVQVHVGGRSDRTTTATEVTASISSPPTAAHKNGTLVRIWPPRSLTDCGEIYPRFRFTDPLTRWALVGLVLDYEETTAAVVR